MVIVEHTTYMVAVCVAFVVVSEWCTCTVEDMIDAYIANMWIDILVYSDDSMAYDDEIDANYTYICDRFTHMATMTAT